MASTEYDWSFTAPEVPSPYRNRQIELHDEIQEKIFDLVVEKRFSTSPLANFFILMKHERFVYASYEFMGRMADLSEEQILVLRKSFYIFEDAGGTLREKFEIDGRFRIHDLKTSKPSYYIVQGSPPNKYNRHDIGELMGAHIKIDTPICSTIQDFKDMQQALYSEGFGSIWRGTFHENNVERPGSYYRLFDFSDEEIRFPDKVKFLIFLENLNECPSCAPWIILWDPESAIRSALDADPRPVGDRRTFGPAQNESQIRDPRHEHAAGRADLPILAYALRADPVTLEIHYPSNPNRITIQWDKVPSEMLRKHLRISSEFPVVTCRNTEYEKRGKFIFLEGHEETQKRNMQSYLKASWTMLQNHRNSRSTSLILYDEVQFMIFQRHLGFGFETETRVEQKPKRSLVDFCCEAFQKFMKDILQKSDGSWRQIITEKAKRGLYHDFGPSCFPKCLLLRDLNQAGYKDLATLCERGCYDF
jgi:hypothetical protein